MSRDKDYQRLLNSKQWKTMRQRYLQAHPLCERCLSKRLYVAAVDLHHRIPCESAHTLQEMRELCFDWNNIEALCIPCHIAEHADKESHTKAAHQQREFDRLERFKEKVSKPPS